MRLVLLTTSNARSPSGRALLNNLAAVGHEVSAVKTRRGGPIPKVAAEIVHPETSTAVDLADSLATASGGWVMRRPEWPKPARDLVDSAPADPAVATPAGSPPPARAPWETRRGRPLPDRHRRRRVVVCFRSTPASPGHHLVAALERAGVDTIWVDDTLDWGEHATADLVVLVESPMPPIRQTGANPGVPVVFWVHHGEHHLEGNVRLSRRYQADVVALAHSWHLAYRFPTRVERLPFAVPGDAAGSRPFGNRRWNLAFVGAVDGPAYRRRRELLLQAESGLEAVRRAAGIGHAEMLDLYGDARMVLNDGGSRHHPITMRVFEAVGSGALLVSEPAPGLELVLGEAWEPVPASGLDTGRLREMLADGTAERIAVAATAAAGQAHTYDHRVDQVLALAAELDPEPRRPPPSPTEPLARFLAENPYGQRILDTIGLVEAPDREVWTPGELRTEPTPGAFDTVVAGPDTPPSLLAAARRFVVGHGMSPDRITVPIRRVSTDGDLTVVALAAPGYDADTVGGAPDR